MGMYNGFICTLQGALRDILFWMRLGLHLKDQSRANEKKVHKIEIFDVFWRNLPKIAKNMKKILFGIERCVIHVNILILGC